MEAAATEQPAESTDGGRDLKQFLVPGLIAGLVVAVATAAVFGVLWLQSSDADPEKVGEFLSSQTPQVEKTASEVVNLLTNYDAANIDSIVDRMLEITTGSFRKDYNDTFEAGFADAIKDASTSARGQIVTGPDISFRAADEAVAVVRVSQTIQNNQNPGGRTFVDVMQITLIDTEGGGWKADRVEILGGQEA